MSGLLVIGAAALSACGEDVSGEARPAAEDAVSCDAAVVLVLDVSLSMEATDVAPSRLLAAQQAARDFAAGLPQRTPLGLVTFAGTASVLTSPTTDRGAFTSALETVTLSERTATGEGIYAGLSAFAARGKRRPAPDRPALRREADRAAEFGRATRRLYGSSGRAAKECAHLVDFTGHSAGLCRGTRRVGRRSPARPGAERPRIARGNRPARRRRFLRSHQPRRTDHGLRSDDLRLVIARGTAVVDRARMRARGRTGPSPSALPTGDVRVPTRSNRAHTRTTQACRPSCAGPAGVGPRTTRLLA
ncbi:VWA domain-containing protein [Nocardia cyriacigeorgica]|nr:VWA domain-containing protein [Nocardia cyriacigeorgica]